MVRAQEPNPPSTHSFEFPDELRSAGAVVSIPKTDNSDAPEGVTDSEYWNKNEREESERLLELFYSMSRELGARAEELSLLSKSRLKRYRFTRVSVVIFMLAALLAILYSAGFGQMLLQLAPIILGAALLLYVIEAFLRDFEVALRASRASDEIVRALKKARLDWATAGSDNEKTLAILVALNNVSMDASTILAAEQMAPISEIGATIQGIASAVDASRSRNSNI